MSVDIYIGMPVHRGAEFIGAALGAIRMQTYRDFRVVMSVDGPDDPTIEACRSVVSDDRFELVVQPRHLGWPGNFNWLARRCDLEYFCYWQQDDTASPDYLQGLHSTIRADPDTSIAYTDVQWTGNRADRDTAVDIVGTPLERVLQEVEALHYVPLRGLVRTDRIPDRADPIPVVATSGHQQEFVYLAELAARGGFRRSDRGLYFKRAHDSNAHTRWMSEPDGRRRDEWCALGNGLIRVAESADPAVHPGRLLGTVLDRLTIARAGRGHWYTPEQTVVGVSRFVREFFGRYPDRLRRVLRTEPFDATGFERPVHPWVDSAIEADRHAGALLDRRLGVDDSAVVLEFHRSAPATLLLGHGWSVPEPWGVWTEGTSAEITLPPHRFARAHLRGHPFSPHGAVRFGVSAGNGPISSTRSDTESSLTVDLPFDATGHRARVLRVHTPAAISPIDAGVSDDPRRLGFGLRNITLER